MGDRQKLQYLIFIMDDAFYLSVIVGLQDGETKPFCNVILFSGSAIIRNGNLIPPSLRIS